MIQVKIHYVFHNLKLFHLKQLSRTKYTYSRNRHARSQVVINVLYSIDFLELVLSFSN